MFDKIQLLDDYKWDKPTLPKPYWNVYSLEERVKWLITELIKIDQFLKDLLDRFRSTLKSFYDRCDAIEKRMDALEARMDAIDKRMDDAKEFLEELRARITEIENRIAESLKEMEIIEENVIDIVNRANEANSTMNSYEDNIEELQELLNEIEDIYNSIPDILTDINSKIESINERTSVLDTTLGNTTWMNFKSNDIVREYFKDNLNNIYQVLFTVYDEPEHKDPKALPYKYKAPFEVSFDYLDSNGKNQHKYNSFGSSYATVRYNLTRIYDSGEGRSPMSFVAFMRDNIKVFDYWRDYRSTYYPYGYSCLYGSGDRNFIAIYKDIDYIITEHDNDTTMRKVSFFCGDDVKYSGVPDDLPSDYFYYFNDEMDYCVYYVPKGSVLPEDQYPLVVENDENFKYYKDRSGTSVTSAINDSNTYIYNYKTTKNYNLNFYATDYVTGDIKKTYTENNVPVGEFATSSKFVYIATPYYRYNDKNLHFEIPSSEGNKNFYINSIANVMPTSNGETEDFFGYNIDSCGMYYGLNRYKIDDNLTITTESDKYYVDIYGMDNKQTKFYESVEDLARAAIGLS